MLCLPWHKYLILNLLLCAYLSLPALTVTAQITDEQGKPVKDALISDGYSQVRSSDTGTFNLDARSETITISRLGFETLKLRVEKIDKSIVLISAPLQLSPIRTVARTEEVSFGNSADLISIRQDPDKHYNSVVQILDEDASFYSPDIRLKGERNTISLDGNLARHTLVILDGIPQNTQGEPFDLSTLDPEKILSMKYIKNNASVYGGSAAIGGILYIHTKRHASGTGISAGTTLEFASYGYLKRAMNIGVSSAVLSWRLRVSDYHTRNDFTYTQPNWWSGDSTLTRDYNAKKAQTYDLSLGTKLGRHNISYNLSYEDFYRELPGPVNFPELYQGANLKGNSLRHNLDLERTFGEVSTSTTLWQSRSDTRYKNKTAPLSAFYSHNRQDLNTLGAKRTLTWNHNDWETALNLEYLHHDYDYEDLQNSDANIRTKLSSYSGALRTGYTFRFSQADLMLNGIGRYDHHDEEDAYTWRTEIKALHEGTVTLESGASLGTSFSLPSLYDLYWKGDTQAIGNPELKSERSQGWQAWLSAAYAPLSLNLNYSDNRIEDLIQWRQVMMNGTVWKPLNIDSARIRNLGLSLNLEPFSWLCLDAMLSHCSARDTTDPENQPRLMYTPVSQYAFRAELSYSSFWLRSVYSLIGQRYTTPDNLIDPLPSYSLMDLEAGLNLSLGHFTLQPSLSLNNLLNSDYQVYPYIPQPGRNWALSLRIGYGNPGEKN